MNYSNVMKILKESTSRDLKNADRLLETADHYPALKVALNCDPFVVYQILDCSYDSLCGFFELYSMIVNGLYDDSSLKVERTVNGTGKWSFYSYKIVLGNYDKRSITEEELIHLLSLKQKRQDYYVSNGDAIENRYIERDGKRFLSEEALEWSRLGKEVKKYFEYLWNLQEGCDKMEV